MPKYVIERDLTDLTKTPDPTPGLCGIAAAAALGLDTPRPLQGVHLFHPLTRDVVLETGETGLACRVCVSGPGAFKVSVMDRTLSIGVNAGRWSIDGNPVPARAVTHPGGGTGCGDGAYSFDLGDPLERHNNDDISASAVLAPMPGQVKSVLVTQGSIVAEGAPMVVMEAMKMEHSLRAPRDGVIASVAVAEGDQVAQGAVLIALEDPAP